jgi:hypothetical protein
MTNTELFAIAWAIAMAAVIVSRAFGRHEIKQLEEQHRIKCTELQAKNDKRILMVLQAAYQAGQKDPQDRKKTCKCSAKSA